MTRQTLLRFSLAFVTASACFSFLTQPASATDVPQNLGNGLDKLLQSRLELKARAAAATKDGSKTGRAVAALPLYNGYATEEAANYASLARMDAVGRPQVRITLTGRVEVKALRSSLEASIPSLQITAVDYTYRGVGVIEGYVDVDDVAALANTKGVRAVVLGLKPYHKRGPLTRIGPVTSALTRIGTAFDQGVTQHRIDKINQIYDPSAPVNYDGSGMSIGCLSDSYDTRSASPHAATGVANFDLPGAAGNPYNTQPVVVLEDDPGGTDEGRAMCEIAYKMAPKARIAFATADTGEVGFANNIRALAGIPDYVFDPSIQQGFKADTICDDVGYYDEPFFQDGIISGGIDDAAAFGVSYFSSAANDVGTNGYDSDLRPVPNGSGVTAATNSALVGTNIDLTGVDPTLYAGGFHNFNPNGLDVAQTVNLPSGGNTTVMQWDDPYDTAGPILNQPPLYSNTGTISSTVTSVTFSDIPALTAGVLYQIQEAGVSGNIDGIVTVIDPNGNTLINMQDTQIDESVLFFAPVSGVYTVRVNRFGSTTGTFSLTVNSSPGYAGNLVTTDLNLLVFRADTGAFISSSSITANNYATNQPLELGTVTRPSGQTQVQFVIAYRNPPVAGGASHVRWTIPGNGAGNIGPAEYINYHSPITSGHATARGCNGTAAYSVFRPSIPESFTSPGPATIYFDKDGNRLPTPEIRLQPSIAAADAANTSFFTSDSSGDGDSNQNFSGTSAAGPHAAAIAALVLQAHGGPGTVTPTQMKSLLQRSTFPHDLDPYYSSATARATNGGKITVTFNSDNNNMTNSAGNDANSCSISYVGPGYISAITFNPEGTAATGGSVTSGNNGVDATFTYFSNSYPGVAFLPATKAFTVGNSTGLVAGDVVAAFSNLCPAPSNGTTQWWTMGLTFPNNNFTGGNVLRYTVGRGQQHSATVGTFANPTGGAPFGGPASGTTGANYSADLFGGGVFIPEGTVANNGMTFSGTVSDGKNTYPFSGRIQNRVGFGFSPLDGFGFINAETAVNTPLD